MASITSTITLADRMTPVLGNIINSMERTINMLDRTDEAVDRTFDPSQIDGARSAIANAHVQLNEIEEQLIADAERQEGFNQKIRQGTTAADGLLGKIMGFAGAYLGVSKLVGLSDTITQTTARLNLINDNLQTTSELEDKIFASAQRSRAEYNATADVVAKLAQRADSVWNSNDETIQFAENLNKQFVIAGASQQEMQSASLQLIQALGSGVLRGEELNAVFESAPNIIQTIADYMDVPIGKIREMAADGQISADIVKNAVLGATDEINRQFESMPYTWAQVWTMFANKAERAARPLLNAVSAVAQNWSVIEPIVLGLAGAIGVYILATQGAAFATKEWAAAQSVLNSVMAMNPIFLVVMGVMLLIAAFYAVIAVINKVKGTSISATGIIVGGLNVILQAVWNLAKFAANVMLGIINWVSAGCANIKILFHNSIEGVKSYFWDLLAAATEVIAAIAEKLNALPFVSIDVDGLTSAAEGYRSKAEAAINGKLAYEDTKQAFWDGFNTLDAFGSGWAKDAFSKGYSVGEGLADKFSGGLDSILNYGNAAEYLSDISGDTSSISGAVSTTEEELKYLREIAERDAINRFTTAEIKVDMSGMNNNITNGMDIDGVIDHMANGASEALESAAEGVHAA